MSAGLGGDGSIELASIAPTIELTCADGWCGLGPRVPRVTASEAALATKDDGLVDDLFREAVRRVRVPPPLRSAVEKAAELCEGVCGDADKACRAMQHLVTWVDEGEGEALTKAGGECVPAFVNLRLLALGMHSASPAGRGGEGEGKDLFVRCKGGWVDSTTATFAQSRDALEKLTTLMGTMLEAVKGHPDHDEQAMLMVWLCGGGDFGEGGGDAQAAAVDPAALAEAASPSHAHSDV